MRLLLAALLAQAPVPATPPEASTGSPASAAEAPAAEVPAQPEADAAAEPQAPAEPPLDESALTPPPLVEAPLDEVPGGTGGDGMDRDAGPAAHAVLPPPPPAPPPASAPTPPLVQGAPAQAVVPQPTYPGFVKGELSQFLGADRVVTRNNRVGISLGLDRIGDTFYGLVEPQVDLRFLDNRLALGLGVPLRFELFSLGGSSLVSVNNVGRIRREDYDQPGEYARVLKYLTFGSKEDNVYVNVGQRYASSIGHGTLVRRYAPNIDVNRARISAQVDAYNDYGGVELLTNDVVDWNLLAGLAFVKPLAFFSQDPVARSLSVGVSVASDRSAPHVLTTDPVTGVRQVDSSGHLQASRRSATLVGIDAEVKVLKTRHADIKPYVDYSFHTRGDGGLTAGVLGRFNVGERTVHAFRVIAEGRALGARYLPSYFDTFYEVERFMARQVTSPWPAANAYETKQQYVLSGDLGNRLGYYLEASYGVRRNIGVTVALEGTSTSPQKNLVAHLELPALDWLQFFGSYYKRGFTQFSDVTKLDSQSIFFAGARLKALPVLFINARAFKSFQANQELQRYDNTFGFAVDVELGLEFKAKEPTPEPSTGSDGHAEAGPFVRAQRG
ncbi:MAG: hypothetical protein RL653_596 [Pseudomonadota bacterium]